MQPLLLVEIIIVSHNITYNLYLLQPFERSSDCDIIIIYQNCLTKLFLSKHKKEKSF